MYGETLRQDDSQDDSPGDAPVSAWLVIVHGEQRGTQIEVPVSSLIIGRADDKPPEEPHLMLQDRRVSRRHAMLRCGPLGWTLRDLGSSNRGFVNGAPYGANAEIPLMDRAVLRMGDTLMVFRERGPSKERPRGAPAGGAPVMPGGPAPTALGYDQAFPGISPDAHDVRHQLARLAANLGPVLILGETGTGKEHVSRALRREGQPFVPVNCAQLGKELVASELFGHARAAFTGAVGPRTGLVEAAHGGILFLDEIGELEFEVQAVLLRFLEDGRFRPVGATELRHSSARVVAATNVNLETAIQSRAFRADLYARLLATNSALQLPPLRERREDLLTWAERFWRESNPTGDSGSWSASAAECLLLYGWPHNLRELSGVMRTLGTTPPAPDHHITLDVDHLPPHIRNIRSRTRDRNATPSKVLTVPDSPAAPPRKDPSEDEVREALNDKRGNMRRTAGGLGVERRRLYRLVEQYKINIKDFRTRGAPRDEDEDDEDEDDDKEGSDDKEGDEGEGGSGG